MTKKMFDDGDLPEAGPPQPRQLFIRREEAICLDDAVEMSGVKRRSMSESSMRKLVKKHRIYRQMKPNSPLIISAPGLMMLFHGDLEALELLRQDNRLDPRVKRYFDELGIPLLVERRAGDPT